MSAGEGRGSCLVAGARGVDPREWLRGVDAPSERHRLRHHGFYTRGGCLKCERASPPATVAPFPPSVPQTCAESIRSSASASAHVNDALSEPMRLPCVTQRRLLADPTSGLVSVSVATAGSTRASRLASPLPCLVLRVSSCLQKQHLRALLSVCSNFPLEPFVRLYETAT